MLTDGSTLGCIVSPSDLEAPNVNTFESNLMLTDGSTLGCIVSPSDLEAPNVNTFESTLMLTEASRLTNDAVDKATTYVSIDDIIASQKDPSIFIKRVQPSRNKTNPPIAPSNFNKRVKVAHWVQPSQKKKICTEDKAVNLVGRERKKIVLASTVVKTPAAKSMKKKRNPSKVTGSPAIVNKTKKSLVTSIAIILTPSPLLPLEPTLMASTTFELPPPQAIRSFDDNSRMSQGYQAILQLITDSSKDRENQRKLDRGNLVLNLMKCAKGDSAMFQEGGEILFKLIN